ncbi:MAG: YHS domain-containing (seleno)protein [Pseudomonadota bacterium]
MTPASAGQAKVFKARGGVAINGYDPVAYFTQGKPVRGDKKITHSWNGAKWQFSSAEHRDQFAANPEKYAPQYGGYCAYAIGNGYTAPTVPEAWDITNGKLYLNYSKSVQRTWAGDKLSYIRKGDKNWPKVLN